MADTTFGPKGWTPERLGNLGGKTYVITGANAGTGFQAARILLGKGAKVVMLNRSAEKSAAAIDDLRAEFGADADVSFVQMDLAELASVRSAAEEVLKSVPRIDAPSHRCRRKSSPRTVLKASLAPTIMVTLSSAECFSTVWRKRRAGSSLSPA